MLPTRERLAAACRGRVLDVGCGRSPLPGAVGIDVASGGLVRGDMRALPFADASFDTVASHLGFDVVPDLDPAMTEARRVLRPGGQVVAIVGGGPVADPAPGDALVELARRMSIGGGDRRARDARAWHAWWPHVDEERIELSFGGPAQIVWPVLAYLARLPLADSRDPRPEVLAFRAVFWLIRAWL